MHGEALLPPPTYTPPREQGNDTADSAGKARKIATIKLDRRFAGIRTLRAAPITMKRPLLPAFPPANRFQPRPAAR